MAYFLGIDHEELHYFQHWNGCGKFPEAFFIGQKRLWAINPARVLREKGQKIPQNKRQRSSGVEQRTHKPFVGGSNPPVATTFQKPQSFIIKGLRLF